MNAPQNPKKYVIVLAHADGWGALSANKVVKAIHAKYPELGIYLAVSQATKDKQGNIATKLDDLKTSRQLKEPDLLAYFATIDAMYDGAPSHEDIVKKLGDRNTPKVAFSGKSILSYFKLGKKTAELSNPELLTFKQLAKRYCTDATVHFTDRGGPKGGEQMAAIIEGLEQQNGKGPEVLLSVDTMAILPKALLERYPCFSTHPGPLDQIKIEGMQGTLRSLANEATYDANGEPWIPQTAFDHMGVGHRYMKGTLFLQHPELDKGPPIATALTPFAMGMSAYQARDEVYHVLTDKMLELLPVLLDGPASDALVKDATRAKEASDALPHVRIPDLSAEQLTDWQGKVIGVPGSHGSLETIQNVIVGKDYFKHQMRRYYPGKEKPFEKTFGEVFGESLGKLAEQSAGRIPKQDMWARYYSGEKGIKISTTFYDKDGNPGKTFTTGR